jgi:hypothetical protein
MIWKTCRLWPDYQVSSSGLVRRIRSGRVLAQTLSRTGYPRVHLHMRGRGKTVDVHGAKLDEHAVRAIRRERSAGTKLAPLAARYGVTAANISMVALRQSWRHVQ